MNYAQQPAPGLQFGGTDFTPGDDKFPRLPYGLHLLEVQKTIFKRTMKGDMVFIAEVMIVSTSSAETSPGAVHSWYRETGDKFGYALKEIGAFLGAIEGFDTRPPANVLFNEQFAPKLDGCFAYAITDAQPFKGRRLQASLSFNEKDGKEGFAKIHFAPTAAAPLTWIPKPAHFVAAAPAQTAATPAAAPTQYAPAPAPSYGAPAPAYAPAAAPPAPSYGVPATYSPPMPAGYGAPAPAYAPPAAPVHPCPPGVDPAAWAAFQASQKR